MTRTLMAHLQWLVRTRFWEFEHVFVSLEILTLAQEINVKDVLGTFLYLIIISLIEVILITTHNMQSF